MKKDLKFYFKLFMSTFSLSAFTFGGGYVIVPLMRKKFVDHYKWIDEKEMLDLTAIAQSSPGAIAVNASVLVGYRLAGIIGSVITIIGTVLPPLIILSAISLFYTAFRDNVTINAILKGMQAGVAAIIIDVVYTMCSNVVKEKDMLSIAIMIGAFIATYFLNINIMIIIAVCGLLGVLSYYFKDRNKKVKHDIKKNERNN